MEAERICVRCRELFGNGDKCQECGVHKDRVVRRIRRRTKSTGKRGHNSGTTGTAKNKK